LKNGETLTLHQARGQVANLPKDFVKMAFENVFYIFCRLHILFNTI